MQLTIEVPNHLGQQLLHYQDRLPEVLARGVRDLEERSTNKEMVPTFIYNENDLLRLLASQPAPQIIIGIQPAPTLQARINDLLWRGKQGVLSSAENTELTRVMTMEHLVRLAKAHALKQLKQ